MYSSNYMYHHEKEELHGFLAKADQESGKKRPAVLVAHDWSGRNDFACQKAQMLADMGYVGFALDMYGDAKVGATDEECSSLMTPFVQDRKLLQERMLLALEAMKKAVSH